MSELAIVSAAQSVIVGSPLAIAVAVFVSRWLIFAFLPLAIFYVVRDHTSRHAVSEAAWALIVALIATTLLSRVIDRPRPFEAPANPETPIVRLIPPPHNASFPSGHTGSAVAMAAAFVFANRRIGYVAVCVAAAIAMSRVLVGVHYPSDLLGGILMGLSAFFIVRFFHSRLRQPGLNRSAARHRHLS